jgi:formylglycine-generating enzyme required for sulfatase activity
MSSQIPPTDPPFIGTQKVHLLTAKRNVRRWISTDALRRRRKADSGGRGAEGDAEQQGPDPWVNVPREGLLEKSISVKPPEDAEDRILELMRMAVTSDAGMGKSTTVKWLFSRFNRPGAETVAFLLNVSDLPNNAEQLFEPAQDGAPGTLVKKFREAQGNSDCADAQEILLRLRDQGRLALVLDGLDEVNRDSPAFKTLSALLSDSAWDKCRIILAGRPYALDTLWTDLFRTDDPPQWRFVLVDEFSEEEQRAYLGDHLFNAVKEHAEDILRDILTVPRVLYYLRQYVSAPENIRTASDVLWTAVRRMLLEGMRGGGRGGAQAAAVEGLSGHDAWLVLSAMAYEIVIVDGNFEGVAADEPFIARVASGCRTFRERELRPGRMSPFGAKDWTAWVTQKLKQLAALNTFLKHGFLEHGFPGLIQFRNRSLGEFFAALWMSRYCLEEDVDELWKRLPLAHDEASQAWYWTFRFAAEMPKGALDEPGAEARSPRHWLAAMRAVYRPGDGTDAGTKRPTEIIYRSWKTLMEYVEDDKLQQASELLNDWRGEFQRILDDRSEANSTRREWAIELTQSFAEIPAGTLEMGSPRTVQARYLDEPEGLALAIAAFGLCRYPGLNGHYRLFDPGHGLKDRQYPWRHYHEISPGDRHPAVYVSWYDAWAYSQWVRWMDGNVIRQCCLPFEHEWEWAAKGGEQWFLPYWWGREFDAMRCHAQQGWVSGATAPAPKWENGKPHLRENPYGLLDILGNVWEWCRNVYTDSVQDESHVTREDGGPSRAFRGGGWDGSARDCRSARRGRGSPGDRHGGLGFRLALVRSAEPGARGAG